MRAYGVVFARSTRMAAPRSSKREDKKQDYLLRGIEPELWQRVKDKADREDRTVRVVLLRLLRKYAGSEQN